MTNEPRPTTRRCSRRVAVTLLATTALVAAACGDDNDETPGTESPGTESPSGATTATTGPASTAPSATTAPSGTSAPSGSTTPATGAAGAVEGCGDGSATDPADLSAERAVARCEPGTPAPEPLPERSKVVVSTAFTAEFTAPLLLAQSYGEFDKENIDVEIVTVPFAEAAGQIDAGRIDVAIGGAEAGWYNAVDQGIDLKWIMGNYYVEGSGDTSVPQTGLWVRKDVFSDPENPDLAEMEGKSLASAVGLGSVIAYPIAEAFKDTGISLADVDVQEIPSTDMILALENEAVDAAWLLDPYWIEASQNDDLVLVATQTPGETLGGFYAGSRLTSEEPDVGEAFLRAMIRATNTYLDGDYQTDSEVMDALAEATDTPVESLEATPPLVFDWEIREGTTDRTQGYFIEFDTMEADEPIPESDLVDRSLYLAAVGQG